MTKNNTQKEPNFIYVYGKKEQLIEKLVVKPTEAKFKQFEKAILKGEAYYSELYLYLLNNRENDPILYLTTEEYLNRRPEEYFYSFIEPLISQEKFKEIQNDFLEEQKLIYVRPDDIFLNGNGEIIINAVPNNALIYLEEYYSQKNERKRLLQADQDFDLNKNITLNF